jgi:hypothetical protein
MAERIGWSSDQMCAAKDAQLRRFAWGLEARTTSSQRVFQRLAGWRRVGLDVVQPGSSEMLASAQPALSSFCIACLRVRFLPDEQRLSH